MITDTQCNFLYLADSLPRNYPAFYSKLRTVLNECGVEHALLPFTKDVWAVDFMPIQVSPKRFVQFKYYPDYLRNSKKWLSTISDVDKICDEIGIKPEHSEIILDGGNVVKSNKSVILTDKIFRENNHVKKDILLSTLQDLFQVERVTIIPQDPEDYTGHADGMVRFISDDAVFVNNYHPKYRPQFQRELRQALTNAGLEIHNFSFNPDLDSPDSAIGYYINYLQIGSLIILPTFGVTDLENRWSLNDECVADEIAVLQTEQMLDEHIVKTVYSREVAAHGGVLNCISWKILKP